MLQKDVWKTLAWFSCLWMIADTAGIQSTGRALRVDQAGLGDMLKGSLLSNLMNLEKKGFDAPISQCDSSKDSSLLLFGVKESKGTLSYELPYVVCYSTQLNAPLWAMHMLRRGIKVVQAAPDDELTSWTGTQTIENRSGSPEA
eukprot:TRINITY_DN9547_c0_g1_i1.p1 TRINITY_DN9547_c0_g1~~TRINITY_DN9547_c0_g1_i1.p1  ORF type:complete len:144 (+),score=18.92 TRINITY_DN9547_c0_g1_i1:76-507(+)